MYLAITISAFMNVYWMWLIIMQIVRIIKRAIWGDRRDRSFTSGEDGKQSSDDEGGATPSSARRSDSEEDKVPLI